MSSVIFNIEEAQGAERSEYETTAAAALIEAPTASEAREVEKNAEQAKDAAANAAIVAQTVGSKLTGEPPTTIERVKEELAATTNKASAQGEKDVKQEAEKGAGYVEQAKALASGAVSAVTSTAQAYLPETLGGTPSTKSEAENQSTSNTSPLGVAASAKAGVTSAVTTAQNYVKPVISTAQGYAQPVLESAKGAAENVLGTAGTAPQSQADTKDVASPPIQKPNSDIPATSAPLESGPHTVATPYPSTTTTTGTNIAAVKH